MTSVKGSKDMEREEKGLLEFMKDVQSKEDLRRETEKLLEEMKKQGWSHPIFCTKMLKLAAAKQYLVTSEQVRKLREQKAGYEPSKEVREGKGCCWPFDYSYYIDTDGKERNGEQ